MSLRATLWALDEAPVENPTYVLVLVALADEATDDGRNAYPSLRRIAARARIKERAARYALRALESAGVIRQGDQGAAAARIARGDRRPTVYDLNMGMTWASAGKPRPLTRQPDDEGQNGRGAKYAPRDAGGMTEHDGGHATTSRGASNDPHGGQPDAPNPKDNPYTDPTTNPSPADKSAASETDDANTASANTKASANTPPSDERAERRSQAEALARGWHDRYVATIGPPAGWKQIPLRNMIEAALKAGYAEHEVKEALDRLGRPLPYAQQWQDTLIEVRTGRAPRGQQRHNGNLHLAAPDDPDEIRRQAMWDGTWTGD